MKKEIEHTEQMDIKASDAGVKKKKFNIFAFVLCVIAAFVIWIFVMNTQNSTYTKTFAISIEVVNEEKLLQNTGLTIFGSPERQANITIQGKKIDVQKYSEKDFRAYIDVSSISEKGNHPVSVVVETPTNIVTVMAIDPKTITVYADTLESADISLEAYCQSSTDKYILSTDGVNLKVTGPSTYIDKISKAKVRIPSESYSVGDVVYSSDIELYDAKSMQLSRLYMTFDPEEIKVIIKEINE